MIRLLDGPHLGEYKALVKAFYPNEDCEVELINDDGSKLKNVEKLRLYDELCKQSGRTLPWGDLTGVRPIRLALNKLYEGMSIDELSLFLHNTYRVSDKKIELALRIASLEKLILDDIGILKDGVLKGHYSLYIGIPFCPSRCLYCSFSAFPLKLYEDIIPEYIECLKKELGLIAEVYKGYTLDSIYIGGGTPSTLNPMQLSELCGFVNELFNNDGSIEFCLEAGRPDSITLDKLKALKDSLVNRICINPQTLSDATLKLMGRAHTTEQFYKAFDMTRNEGFDNINTDIILGLSNETDEDLLHTLNGIIDLAPDSLTVHSLAIKRAANLKHETDDLRAAKMDMNKAMELCLAKAGNAGLYPYYLYRQKNMSGNLENTGLSMPGKECKYNILMIDELSDIAAAGVGTVSRVTLGNGHIERVDCVKDVKLYFERFDETIEKKRRFYQKWRPH